MAKSVDNVNQLPGSGPDEVFELIHDVMHLYRGRRHRSLSAGDDRLPHMEAKALAFFSRHPGATLSELAAHSGRDKSQLAKLVASLRERGLVEAKADETDRRNVRLHPTAQAEAMHKAMQQESCRLARTAAGALSEDERRTLVGLLARIRQTLDDSAG